MWYLVLVAVSILGCNAATYPRIKECVCVPFYQCGDDGKIKTWGEGQIDSRIKPEQPDTSECKGADEVCCLPPDDDLPGQSLLNKPQAPQWDPHSESPFPNPENKPIKGPQTPSHMYFEEPITYPKQQGRPQGKPQPENTFGPPETFRPTKGPQLTSDHYAPSDPSDWANKRPETLDPFKNPQSSYTIKPSDPNDWSFRPNNGPEPVDPFKNPQGSYSIKPSKGAQIPPVQSELRRTCGLKRRNYADNPLSEKFSPEQANYGEFPWMIGLFDPLSNQLVCGGSLISEDTVLTSARCVWNVTEYEIIVRAGEWNLENEYEQYPVQDRNIKRIFVHEYFNKENLHYNVAILKLEKPFRLNDVVDIICLPLGPFSASYDHHNCFATGWGKRPYTPKGKNQQVLRKVHVPLVDKETCVKALREERLGKYFRLHDSFVCAGGIPGQDTCYGDGGGPLFCQVAKRQDQYVQVGITSWGLGCGNPIPSVYASLEYLSPWIEQYLY